MKQILFILYFKRLFSATTLLVVLIFSSCQQDDSILPEVSGKDLTITLELPATSSENAPVTYAMPADEEKIEHLAVLAFRTNEESPNDVDKGIFLYRAEVSYSGPNPSSCVIKVQEMADAQTFVIIANARDIMEYNTIQIGDTKAQVIQKLVLSKNEAFDAGTMTSIPMWGEVQNKVINNGVIPTGITCKLYRTLAKINVKVDGSIPTNTFELRSVRLYMPRQKGALIPGNWGPYTGTLPGEPDEAVSMPTEPTDAGTIPSRQTAYTYTTTTNNIEDVIYTFEARNTGTPAVEMPDRTCLVVGGWYKGDSGKEYYYRIDLKSGDTQLDILRNFIYNVTINNIGGMGVENPDDAYKGLSVIEAVVEPWNPVTGNVQVGTSHLYVSQRYPWIKIDGTTELYTGSKTVTIKTTDPAGWKFKDNDPTTQATLAWANPSLTGGAKGVSVDVSFNPGAGPSEGREGSAVIVSGNLEYTIYFIQDDCGRRGIAAPQKIGNNTYKTHRYGTDCWMVENSKEGIGSGKGYGLDWAGINNGSIRPPGSSTLGSVNGYYYTWEQAAQSNNVCPNGWHLPSESQWNNLKSSVSIDFETNNTSIWWTGPKGAVNNAFAGYGHPAELEYLWLDWGTGGFWWSATESLQYFNGRKEGFIGPYKETRNTVWHSVRCVQN